VRDIYELIRQRETEIERLQKDIERVQTEVEALQLAAKLLDDSTEAPRPIAVPATIAREGQGYPTPAVRPATATPTPGPWASAKQFP
jgi:arsenate reductase-like glutaredoxin family protein